MLSQIRIEDADAKQVPCWENLNFTHLDINNCRPISVSINPSDHNVVYVTAAILNLIGHDVQMNGFSEVYMNAAVLGTIACTLVDFFAVTISSAITFLD